MLCGDPRAKACATRYPMATRCDPPIYPPAGAMPIVPGKEKGTFYFSPSLSSRSASSNNDLPASCFFGRPRGRRLDSNPNSWAVFAIHGNVPYGRPRWMLSRSRFTSSSGKEKGTFYFSPSLSSRSASSNNDLPASCFFGRPRGRRLDSNPNSWAVFAIHGNGPYG